MKTTYIVSGFMRKSPSSSSQSSSSSQAARLVIKDFVGFETGGLEENASFTGSPQVLEGAGL